MKRVCIWLIRFYQRCISPMKRSPCCRFYPTCSAYAIEAFQEWGFFAGLGLTVWRILRCNPFCRGGYDPVPERKRKRRQNVTTGGKDSSEDVPKSTENNEKESQ